MPEHDASWTPGPWRIRDEDGPPLTDVMVGERLLATAYPDHTKHAYPERVLSAEAILRSCAEAAANARLIAAAPALYDALKAISDMLFLRPDMVAVLRPRMGPAEHAVSEAARSALALARGETNG